MAAENYHLKWDSHLSYLNSSVATLYKNEKFADVVLYSSSGSNSINSAGNNSIDNAIPTVGISAHKFILSSCSQFFATMFDSTPISSSNGLLYVVLPPDLSHRAIQILVQYIYTGEATVSNDILNEVLRGGEILKIRGLCRTSSQRDAANTGLGGGGGGSNGNACNNSLHYGTNGTRPHHLAPPPPSSSSSSSASMSTVLTHGSVQLPNIALATDLYAGNKCTAQSNVISGNCTAARYALDQIAQSHSSIHTQIRGLGASVMPKDSPVIVKSPKLSQMALLPSTRENKQTHGSGITVNKEVAIDPDEKCCYQSNATTLRQHDTLQLSLPPTQPIVAMNSGSLCNDMSCKNCLLNVAMEPDKQQRQRQRHHSQSKELPQRLLSIERLERDFVERTMSEELCERHEVQLSYNRRTQNENERVANFFANDQYDQTQQQPQAHLIKTPKQYVGEHSVTATQQPTSHNHLSSPPLYPHTFLTIKQEPIDWTTPQPTTSMENNDNSDLIDHPPIGSPQQQPTVGQVKQPLDFKMPIGSAANVKLEVIAPTHGNDDDEMPVGPATMMQYSGFSRLVCDVCKKSFDEPKLWVQHLETHTTTASSAAAATTTTPTTPTTRTSSTAITPMAMATNNSHVSTNDEGGGDAVPKSYVPKKRRRVSQQENNMMDHVTLLCDLCNTSFDTPAEWVRHMNNQHTEIELAMFNSKKDKEQKTNSASAMTCSVSSRNHHHVQHHSQHQHHHHQQQQQQQQQQSIHKKYANKTTTVPSTLSSNETNNSPLIHKRGSVVPAVNENHRTKQHTTRSSSSPTTAEQQQQQQQHHQSQIDTLKHISPTPSPPQLQSQP